MMAGSKKIRSTPMSPMTTALCIGATLFWAIVILRPTPWELFVAISTDTIVGGIFFWVDQKVFIWLCPEYALIHPEPQYDALARLDTVQRLTLLNSLNAFTRKRGLYFFFGNLIKAIPATLIVVFYWKHSISNLQQALLNYFMAATVYAYLYGACTFEYHAAISAIIAEIHRRFDWSATFKQVQLASPKQDLLLHEGLALGAIIFLIGLCQGTVVMSYLCKPMEHRLFLDLAILNIVALVIFAHLWYLGRNYLHGGLISLFGKVESFDYSRNPETLPLHSSPLLAHLEGAFNSLGERLRASEQNLAQWMLHEIEESRFRAVGEISGLVAHDLMAPLSTLQFCATEIGQNPEVSIPRQSRGH